MRKFGIFSTIFVQSASYKRQALEAVKYIGSNPNQCLIDSELKNFILTKTQSSFATPITQLYNHLIDTFKGKNELPFPQLFISAPNPPEVFTYDSFTFSTEELMGNPAPFLKGTIVNLTNSVKMKPSMAGKNYMTDDLIKLHSLYMRAALCESYLKSSDQVWMNPKIALFIVKTYSMILLKQIGIFYHINDPLMIKRLSILNHIFYCNLMDKEVDKGMSELIYRSNVAAAIEIKEVLNILNDHGYDFEKRYNIMDLCGMYQAIGGEKLQAFDLPKLFKLFTAGTIDKTYGGVCLEYPPYWVHQLLMIGSGQKHAVYYKIFKDTGILRELIPFAHDLNTCPNFINRLGEI